ncbi:hypothetical protein ES703_60419 [subsurface metagenome]
MTKKWYHSKTLYTNLIGAAVILATVFGYEDISAKILAAEVAILTIANLVLRIVTNQGLEK